MKTAYICSPLSGDIKDNIRKAKLYGKYAFKRGMAPVIPHIYAEILCDDIPSERELGMRADRELLFKCDELWVFGDTITKGMKEEIHFAKMINTKIKYILNSEVDKYEC